MPQIQLKLVMVLLKNPVILPITLVALARCGLAQLLFTVVSELKVPAISPNSLPDSVTSLTFWLARLMLNSERG